jgi:hypothetical protein
MSCSIPEITAFAQSKDLVLKSISFANEKSDYFSIAVFSDWIWVKQ